MNTTGHKGQGYVYVVNWDEYQHPDAVRSENGMPWFKTYTKLLGNDDWLELTPADRTLLLGLWMLTGRYGNGRVRADSGWLNSQLKIRKGSLDRLSDAGFIEVHACKAASNRASKPASLEGEEGSKEPSKKKIESAASNARRNGALAAAKNGDDPDPIELARRRLRSVRTNYQGVLLENGAGDADEWLRENHPDLVDQVISRKPAQKESA